MKTYGHLQSETTYIWDKSEVPSQDGTGCEVKVPGGQFCHSLHSAFRAKFSNTVRLQKFLMMNSESVDYGHLQDVFTSTKL